MYKAPRLNNEEIENLNRSIISKEVELIFKNLPKKMSRTRQLHSEFYQILHGEFISILLKLLQN